MADARRPARRRNLPAARVPVEAISIRPCVTGCSGTSTAIWRSRWSTAPTTTRVNPFDISVAGPHKDDTGGLDGLSPPVVRLFRDGKPLAESTTSPRTWRTSGTARSSAPPGPRWDLAAHLPLPASRPGGPRRILRHPGPAARRRHERLVSGAIDELRSKAAARLGDPQDFYEEARRRDRARRQRTGLPAAPALLPRCTARRRGAACPGRPAGAPGSRCPCWSHPHRVPPARPPRRRARHGACAGAAARTVLMTSMASTTAVAEVTAAARGTSRTPPSGSGYLQPEPG